MNKAKKILIALQEHLNIKNFKELAEYLGISTSLLYSWVRHGNIAGTGKILAKIPYLELSWLETAEGPMMIIDQDNIHLIPASKYAPPSGEYIPAKIAARIEPGNADVKSLLMKPKKIVVEKSQEQAEDETPISEMLVMTSKVLESKTVYRSALASNVRAFYQAVVQEDEMQSLNDKMELMQAQMARMESMLNALNAALPQKREEGEGANNTIPRIQSATGGEK